LIKKFRSYTKLILIALFLFALFAGGCGGSSSKTTSETPTTPETPSETPATPETPSVTVRKIAVLGDPSEELRQFLTSDGIQVETFDENNPTAYPTVVITREKLAELVATADSIETDDIIRAIFDSDTDKVGHILLFRPDNSDIEKLGELLGESFGIMKTVDGAPLLYYALDKDEDDGFVRVLAQLDSSAAEDIIDTFEIVTSGDVSQSSEPSGSDETDEVEVTPAGGLSRDGLAKWLDGGYEDGRRKSVSRGADDDRVNLVELAKSYKATFLFYPWDQIGGVDGANRKSIQTNVFVTSAHQFDDLEDAEGGRDWYYVMEDNLFDGTDDYHKGYQSLYYRARILGSSYWIGGADVADQYFKEVEINHYLSLNGLSTDDIVFTQAQPQAVNKETTTTLTTEWGMGATVGAGYEDGKPKAEGSLSFNVGFSNSTSFNTPDVGIQMKYSASAKEPGWIYQYKGPERDTIHWKLIAPAELSHSIYSPKQSWIWGIPSKKRSINSFKMTAKAIRACVLLRNSGTIWEDITGKSNNYDGTVPGVTIKLPQPPLLALEEKNFVFGRQESTKTTRIMAQGGWGATIKGGGGDWLKITTTPERLDIGVTDNDTGQNRTAELLITRTGTTDTATITVTQLTTLTSD
jgi:hypothetical protein